MFDIREHGGIFGGGKRIDYENVGLRKTSSISLYYAFHIAYNGEDDGKIFTSMNNSVGGSYQINQNTTVTGTTYIDNFSKAVDALQRDENYLYVVAGTFFYKYKINSNSIPSRVWAASITTGSIYNIGICADDKIVVSSSSQNRLFVYSAINGSLLDTINLSDSYVYNILVDKDDKNLLYLFLNKQLVKYNLSTKTIIWTANFTFTSLSEIKQTDTHIYLISSNFNAKKILKSNGTEVESVNFGSGWGKLLIDEYKNVYVVSSAGSPNQGIYLLGKDTFNNAVSKYKLSDDYSNDSNACHFFKKLKYVKDGYKGITFFTQTFGLK